MELPPIVQLPYSQLQNDWNYDRSEPLQVFGSPSVTALSQLGGLSTPIVQRDGDEYWVAAAEYELGGPGRVVTGWTVGMVHPLPDNEVYSFLPEFEGSRGQTYVLTEGIVSEQEKSYFLRQVLPQHQRTIRRQMGSAWHLRWADLTSEEVGGLLEVDLGGIPTTVNGREGQQALHEHLQDKVVADGGEDRLLEALTGPQRHRKLVEQVTELVSRKRLPRRIILPWGVMHMEGIDRDVWTPLGFRLVSVRWRKAVRIKTPLEGC